MSREQNERAKGILTPKALKFVLAPHEKDDGHDIPLAFTLEILEEELVKN